VTFTIRDKALVSLMAYAEASSGTGLERRCVVRSAFNRLAAVGKWYHRPTLAGVVLLRAQYSEFNGDKLDNANLERAANATDDDPVMADCYTSFDEAAAGNLADPTRGATHYHDKSIQPPPWADPATGATLALETAKFRFYKGVA